MLSNDQYQANRDRTSEVRNAVLEDTLKKCVDLWIDETETEAYRAEISSIIEDIEKQGDLWEWRYRPSLDLSPWVDSPTTTTSLDRLDVEMWRATARARVVQRYRLVAAGLDRIHA